MFAPSTVDGALKIWHKKGLKCIGQLFINDLFAFFSQLTKSVGIVKKYFFQISTHQALLYQLIPQFPYKPRANSVDMFLLVNPTLKGTISSFTTLFRSCIAPHYLGSAFTDHMWDSVLDLIHSTSMCAQHALVQFKVVNRIHISKNK